MITCKSGVTIRTSIASIREAGRATQGVKLIRLDEGDEIAAITNLNEFDEEIEDAEIIIGEKIENNEATVAGEIEENEEGNQDKEQNGDELNEEDLNDDEI
jgi:DNA gyrase subunit A